MGRGDIGATGSSAVDCAFRRTLPLIPAGSLRLALAVAPGDVLAAAREQNRLLDLIRRNTALELFEAYQL
jgi:hypothetical protein